MSDAVSYVVVLWIQGLSPGEVSAVVETELAGPDRASARAYQSVVDDDVIDVVIDVASYEQAERARDDVIRGAAAIEGGRLLSASIFPKLAGSEQRGGGA